VNFLHGHEQHTVDHYCFFGDSAFAMSRYMQTMLKGAMLTGGRSFKALMSQIRIHVENIFTHKAMVFSRFSSDHDLHLGKSAVHEQYIIATFLMNVRNIFYGNQFLDAIGPDRRLRLSLAGFLNKRFE